MLKDKKHPKEEIVQAAVKTVSEALSGSAPDSVDLIGHS
jgi:hypothetical protein